MCECDIFLASTARTVCVWHVEFAFICIYVCSCMSGVGVWWGTKGLGKEFDLHCS